MGEHRGDDFAEPLSSRKQVIPVRRVGRDNDNSGGTIKAVPSFIIFGLKRSSNPPRCHSSHRLPPFLCFSLFNDLLSTAKTSFRDSESPSKDRKMRMKCVSNDPKRVFAMTTVLIFVTVRMFWLFPTTFKGFSRVYTYILVGNALLVSSQT